MKYLVLVNEEKIYGYDNWQLLKVHITENKGSKFRLWKQVGTLMLTYEPMDVSELEPKPVLTNIKCICGNELITTKVTDGLQCVKPCEKCKENLIKGWLEVLRREVK